MDFSTLHIQISKFGKKSTKFAALHDCETVTFKNSAIDLIIFLYFQHFTIYCFILTIIRYLHHKIKFIILSCSLYITLAVLQSKNNYLPLIVYLYGYHKSFIQTMGEHTHNFTQKHIDSILPMLHVSGFTDYLPCLTDPVQPGLLAYYPQIVWYCKVGRWKRGEFFDGMDLPQGRSVTNVTAPYSF